MHPAVAGAAAALEESLQVGPAIAVDFADDERLDFRFPY